MVPFPFKAVTFHETGGEAEVAEAAAALPPGRLGDAAGVLPVDHLRQPRDYVGVAVLAEFDHDPPPAHLVRDRPSCARPGEGVEDEVAGVGGDLKDPFDQLFWLRGAEV